jgi:PAS domain S-box-containing protein
MKRKMHAPPEGHIESRDLVGLLLESTGEAIYGIDLHGKYMFCNSACVRLLGYKDSAELIGEDMHAKIHHTRADGTPYPREESPIYSAILRGEGSHVDDEIVWRADGTSFPVEYWSFPIRKENYLTGAVVTFIDITERKQVLEQLEVAKSAAETASRANSEFLAQLSHQIRTPLNSITGAIELLIDTELTPEQEEYVRALKNSADSLMTVVDGILNRDSTPG